jgi:hypothetical protein
MTQQAETSTAQQTENTNKFVFTDYGWYNARRGRRAPHCAPLGAEVLKKQREQA